MPTDQQIAILCDIGQSVRFDADKAGQMRDLVAEGCVTRDGELFRLTARGEKLLSDRGAGLNES